MIRPIALTFAQESHAVDMYQDGYSRRQIAATLGVSDMAVRNALKRRKVTPRSREEALRSPRISTRYQHSRPSSIFDLARVVNRRTVAA